MKNTFLVIFLSIFSFSISCKRNDDKKIQVKNNKDTIFLNEKSVLFISPSIKKLEKLKKQYGEDFYTIADDANYYSANALEYMDSLHEKYLNRNENTIIAYKDKGKVKIIPLSQKNWYSILYKNNNYEIVDLVNFKKEYISFFQQNSNDNQNLKTWYGTYLNTDSENVSTYDAILQRIGWYKLSIIKNKVIFENDIRMESEFPTEAPGGIYIKYLCDYKIIGDTIKLFRKDDAPNEKSIEINKTNNPPILILFKKGDKFYGSSSYITDAEDLNNAARIKGKSPYLFRKFDTKD